MGESTDEAPRTIRSYLCIVVLVVLGLLGYLWGHVETMNQKDELKRLQLEQKALLREQDRLKAEASGLRQSRRITAIASERLGMVFPDGPPRNLYLDRKGNDRSGVKN